MQRAALLEVRRAAAQRAAQECSPACRPLDGAQCRGGGCASVSGRLLPWSSRCILTVVAAAAIIASYAVSGYNLRTQVLLMLLPCIGKIRCKRNTQKELCLHGNSQIPLSLCTTARLENIVRGWTAVAFG